MQAPKIAPGVFDVSIHHTLRIRHVAPGNVHTAAPSERYQRRQAKTQRVVEQNIREQSMLKFVTVCRRLNIDALHPRSFHMVLALLSKTDARIDLFHLVRAGDAGVILDMEVAEEIETLQPELLYSVSDWITLFSYMHCEISEREELFVCEDPLVRRFRESLEIGGLHATLEGGTPAVLLCMCHTLPAKTPISQMLERYVVGAAAAAGVQPPRDVEVRCLRTAAHFMDAVISDTAHMTALSRVIACLQTRAVFTTNLQYVLQQEATLREAERDASCAVEARPSLRRVVARVLHERAYYSTQTFANWSSQLQFGVTTSLHAQMLLYFVCAQVIEPDITLYRDLYTDVILERVSRRNGTVDSIDHYAVSKLIRSVRIYKHSIHNLIDFRVQCLAGLSATTRLNLSLADVVQLYICCFQHRSIFEYCWKQVVPVMNHTIQHSCERFRSTYAYDIDAVVRTLVDSSTAVGTTVAADDSLLTAAENAEAAALWVAAGAGELSAPTPMLVSAPPTAPVAARSETTAALDEPTAALTAAPGAVTAALEAAAPHTEMRGLSALLAAAAAPLGMALAAAPLGLAEAPLETTAAPLGLAAAPLEAEAAAPLGLTAAPPEV